MQGVEVCSLSAAPRVELSTVCERCERCNGFGGLIWDAVRGPAVWCQPHAMATMYLPCRPSTTVGLLTFAAWNAKSQSLQMSGAKSLNETLE
jgi:hypothetical protein